MKTKESEKDFRKRLESNYQKDLDKTNREDLKEIAHYYGGWQELRKVIDELEENDKEAASKNIWGVDKKESNDFFKDITKNAGPRD